MPRDLIAGRKDFVKKHKKKLRKPAVSDATRRRKLLSRRKFGVLIREAALELKVVRIRYKKLTTGRIEEYFVEPYSYRIRHVRTGIRKMFFAYDVKDKRIKGFVFVGIRKVEITKRKYKPRWKVEW